MSYIQKIAHAVPSNKHPQMQIAEYMQKVYERSFVVNQIYKESAINYRHSVLKDFGLEMEEGEFFMNGDPSIADRMLRYFEEAPNLALEAIQELGPLNNITHLITVSCTGLAAPGLEILLHEKLEFGNEVQKSTVNFMGCYAAIHALRQADWICKAQKDAQVLIVCVELCTLHFQQEYKFEYLASGSLFADGAAAVLVNNEGEGLEMSGFYSAVHRKASEAMTWELGSKGFLMNLSSKVANSIEEIVVEAVKEAEEREKIKYSEADEWAVHPGGRKIVEVVEESFRLNREKVSKSYEVLAEYGNMSSPTILFILEKILAERQSKSIHAMAFGPGLTIEGLHLNRA